MFGSMSLPDACQICRNRHLLCRTRHEKFPLLEGPFARVSLSEDGMSTSLEYFSLHIRGDQDPHKQYRTSSCLYGNLHQRKEHTMKYTAPSILTTKSAGVAIQSGRIVAAKMQQIHLDSASPQPFPSTTSAYEADE